MKTTYSLNMSQWKEGGVGLWGAAPPVYDTTNRPIEEGIHVHLRPSPGGQKEVDHTYGRLEIRNWRGTQTPFFVDGSAGIHYMVTAMVEVTTRFISCPRCEHPHLDEGWLSVHPHRSHFCTHCRRFFFEKELGIGNPVTLLSEGLAADERGPKPSLLKKLKQRHYPGGMRLWASNPAFYARNQPRETKGIHVHAFDGEGNIVEDETFAKVEVDGIEVEVEMLRVYMAQANLAFLEGRVLKIECPRCGRSHFDRGVAAVSPHELHVCKGCGFTIGKGGDVGSSVGNPVVGVLAQLRAESRAVAPAAIR